MGQADFVELKVGRNPELDRCQELAAVQHDIG